MKFVLVSSFTVALVAALLAAPGNAMAGDKSCLCSVSYVIRPCAGTLTSTKGSTAKKRAACHKNSTRIASTKTDGLKFPTEGKCTSTCRDFGKDTLARIEGSAECKRRPGQNVFSVWRMYFSGKKIEEKERKTTCPDRD